MIDGWHQCERCGYWIEDGFCAVDCESQVCPEQEPHDKPMIVDEHGTIYVGAA